MTTGHTLAEAVQAEALFRSLKAAGYLLVVEPTRGEGGYWGATCWLDRPTVDGDVRLLGHAIGDDRAEALEKLVAALQDHRIVDQRRHAWSKEWAERIASACSEAAGLIEAAQAAAERTVAA